MDKTTNQLINQLHLDGKKENALRKLVEKAGGVNSQTPLVNEVIGDELIPINQNGENKAVTVEQIKNNILSIPSSYEFVDLGLPSGIKWATCNIGASKPEEFGLYFAWGETEGYTVANVEAGRKTFSYDDYKFTNDGGNTFTKYNKEDKKTILDLEDDGAYQYDNTCRIPTREEYQELINNTTQTKEVLNSVDGLRFTSKINNNSIFIPNGGFIEDNSFYKIDNKQYLWTSTRRSNVEGRAYCFYADFNYIETSLIFSYEGFSIRPVQLKSSSVVNLNDIIDKIDTINNINNNVNDNISNINNTINDIKQKTEKIEIEGNGDKFLSDDGTYVTITGNTNYYVWEGSTSKTIYDELLNCYNKGVPVIYKKNGICIATRMNVNAGRIFIYTDNRLYTVNDYSVLEYSKGIGINNFKTSSIKTSVYNICRDIITANKTITFEGTFTEEGIIYEGEFSFGDSVYNITFDEDIKWSTDSILEYKPNHTYQFRIVNYLGVMKEFAN